MVFGSYQPKILRTEQAALYLSDFVILSHAQLSKTLKVVSVTNHRKIVIQKMTVAQQRAHMTGYEGGGGWGEARPGCKRNRFKLLLSDRLSYYRWTRPFLEKKSCGRLRFINPAHSSPPPSKRVSLQPKTCFCLGLLDPGGEWDRRKNCGNYGNDAPKSAWPPVFGRRTY